MNWAITKRYSGQSSWNGKLLNFSCWFSVVMPKSAGSEQHSRFLRCAVSALFEHARVVAKRLQIPNNDSTKLCVGWID